MKSGCRTAAAFSYAVRPDLITIPAYIICQNVPVLHRFYVTAVVYFTFALYN